jgi:hypothetical protein
MAGRPGALPWNMATFSGNEPVTTLSDNFSFLNNQINDSGIGLTSYAIDTGTANNLVVTLASAPVAYETGMMVCTTVANTNTGATVINVNALGNVSVLNPGGIALTGNEISANALLTLVYNGSAFLMLGPCPRITSSTTASSINLNCTGCTSVSVNARFTALSQAVVLNHLSSGIPITIVITNVSGSTGGFSVQANDPSGTAFTNISAVTAGGIGALASIQSGVGSISLTNNQSRVFTGSAQILTLFFT